MVVMAVVMIVLMLMVVVALIIVIVVMVMFVFMIVIVFMIVLMLMIVAVVVVMGMILPRFLFLSVHGDGHVRAGDPAFDGGFQPVDDAGDAEGIELFRKRRRIRQKLRQSRREHIPRRAHIAFDVQGFHTPILSPGRPHSKRHTVPRTDPSRTYAFAAVFPASCGIIAIIPCF